MANLNGFNANQVDPATDFEAIPAGKYVTVVTASEMKPTKNGNGAYLELTFQVIEGEYKNRLLWERLNLDNPNPLTVKIARSELSASVKQKTDADGEVRNEIKGYAKRETAGGAKPAQNANATPPWRRG
jgi:hypothetical protein